MDISHRGKKKILIVSRSFYPMITPRAFRTTELVKEYCRMGHDVTLMTWYDPEKHDKIKYEYGFKIIDLGKKKFNQIAIPEKGITRLITRIYRRVLMLYFEYPDIELMFKVKNKLKSLKDYDLLISIAVPHPIHWGVARSWSNRKKPAKTWIADCGDPYMGETTDSFRKPFYFKYLEKSFCKKADYITVPIKEAVDAYYQEFHHKFKIIPQGFKFEETYKLLSPYKKNDVPTFAYAGTFIPGLRDPRPILEYLNSLNTPFRFLIFTRDRSLVEPFSTKSNGRIEVRSFIPRNELLPILGSMDFLVNIDNNAAEHLPSKLIDYLLTERPILTINSQNINKSDIDDFLKGDYSARYYNSNLDQYKIENICQQFLHLAS